jgi:hypothetical protein
MTRGLTPVLTRDSAFLIFPTRVRSWEPGPFASGGVHSGEALFGEAISRELCLLGLASQAKI